MIHRFFALLLAGALLVACSATEQSSSAAPSNQPSPAPRRAPVATRARRGALRDARVADRGAAPASRPSVAFTPGRRAACSIRASRTCRRASTCRTRHRTTWRSLIRRPSRSWSFAAGAAPEHISPDWDLSKLYVSNMNGASLTVIDPVTNEPIDTKEVPVPVQPVLHSRRVEGDRRRRLPRHGHGRRQRPLLLRP